MLDWRKLNILGKGIIPQDYGEDNSMKTLAKIDEEYQKIILLVKEPMRSHLLMELMTEMEREYHIPMIRTENWEIKNKPVIALYRKINLSKNLNF